jgi:nucleoside-diphosphate-sugar epimerase
LENLLKVLLTGASGFLGRSVVELLSRQGIETVVAGRREPHGVLASKFLHVDLLGSVDFDELVKSSGSSHLLHLAWYTEHGKYWNSPLNLRWIDATVRLTEAFCLAGGQKIVLAGTCAEYDWSYGYCIESNTPLNPATLYGTAKDVTRRLVTAVCAEYKVSCAWGRIFLPYGPGEDSCRVIPALTDVFDGKRVPFGVNAAAFRDFLHVEDVADGFLTMLKSEATGAFNICSGQPVQIAEVVKLLAKSRNADPQLVLDLSTERPGEPPLLVGNNKNILALGWRAKHELSEIGDKGVLK